MEITREEARRIAALAHLEFDDADLERLAAEMTRILGYVDQLKDLSGDDAPVRTPALQTLREDVARQYPKIVDGFFVVPKVIE